MLTKAFWKEWGFTGKRDMPKLYEKYRLTENEISYCNRKFDTVGIRAFPKDKIEFDGDLLIGAEIISVGRSRHKSFICNQFELEVKMKNGDIIKVPVDIRELVLLNKRIKVKKEVEKRNFKELNKLLREKDCFYIMEIPAENVETITLVHFKDFEITDDQIKEIYKEYPLPEYKNLSELLLTTFNMLLVFDKPEEAEEFIKYIYDLHKKIGEFVKDEVD